MRQCNGCTACCEGWLVGQVNGKYFHSGRPCHFKCETGCSIYEQRPEDPCKTYRCEWLNNEDIPEWMKPNLSKIIITKKKYKNGEYLEINEMGQTIDATILNWLFTYHYSTDIPIRVQVNNGWTSYGPKEFLDEVYGLKVSKS